jgi:peptidoglycan hydrolase-like protein with peptidoglycan-binding domain
MRWAAEFKGQLIAGLDGSLYEPYSRAVVEEVQQALIARGLYRGPVNGVLDLPTMQATYEFQKVNSLLQVSGVPSPRTRKVLEQGSHTDPL